MQQLPAYIAIVFGLTTLATLILFSRTILSGTGRSAKWIPAVLLLWLIIQAVLGINGFFTESSALPPRLAFAIGPPFLTMLGLFVTRAGRSFLDRLPLAPLTWLNVVRIPVELVLYWLALHQVLPEEITFTGRNFDVLVGITAPLIAYFGWTRPQIGRRTILVWNIISCGILMNVVVHGLLSVPSPFQQLTFETPNIALLYFPFNWLPAFVVPVALLTHLVSIRRLLAPNPAKHPEISPLPLATTA